MLNHTTQYLQSNQVYKPNLLDFGSIEANLQGRSFVDTTCPDCSPYRKRSNQKKKVFRVWRLNDKAITFNCIHCGLQGTIWKDGCQREVSREEMAKIRAQREAQRVAEETRRIEWALTLWDRAEPGLGTLAEAYFAGRGLVVPEPVWRRIRFIEKFSFGGVDDKLPAVIIPLTRFENPTKICAVQAIALNSHAGNYKLDGTSLKRTFGIVRETGAVMMAPPASHLCVAEGFETALAVNQLGYNGGAPIWATLGAPFLTALPVIQGVDHLTIFADNDMPDKKGICAGIEAAARVEERWEPHCEVVTRHPPVPGTDYADLLKKAIPNV
jgi:hypothetical protein